MAAPTTDAFLTTVSWFNKQPTSANGKPFENVTYFLTDGDPTFSNNGSNGGGNSTEYRDMQDAINAFKSLSGKSTVHAIGIGNGVINEGYLKFFDNTNVTGTGSVSLPTGNWWEGYQTVTGPTGQPQIVNTARDLAAALQGGSTSTDPAAVGNDIINGGAGNDIIFGDTLNTDGAVLNWASVGGRPADLAAGSGLKALQVFLEMRDGHAPTNGDLYQYIKDHHADFNLARRPRGGDDIIHGGTGDDIIYGQGGNDTCTAMMAMTSSTAAGDDKLYGGDGDDKLYGGTGNDYLKAATATTCWSAARATTRWSAAPAATPSSAGAERPGHDGCRRWTRSRTSIAKPTDGGDILDLKELLVGEKDSTLTQYLNFHKKATTRSSTSTPRPARCPGRRPEDRAGERRPDARRPAQQPGHHQ